MCPFITISFSSGQDPYVPDEQRVHIIPLNVLREHVLVFELDGGRFHIDGNIELPTIVIGANLPEEHFLEVGIPIIQLHF